MFQLRKKTIAATTAAFVIAGGGAAYAYWSTTGTGDGTVANAQANGSVTLHASWDASKLAPGTSLPVSFTADNAGKTDLYVNKISVSSITTSDAGCLPGDFTVTVPTTVGVAVAHESTGVDLGQGLISFKNSAVPQDTCKDATVTVNLTSN